MGETLRKIILCAKSFNRTHCIKPSGIIVMPTTEKELGENVIRTKYGNLEILPTINLEDDELVELKQAHKKGETSAYLIGTTRFRKKRLSEIYDISLSYSDLLQML